MTTTVSKILYWVGDKLSVLLQYRVLCMLVYPIYNRIMILSSKLDTKGKVWEHQNSYLNDLKAHITGDSYKPYLDKYKYNQELLNRKINKTK